MKNRVWRRWFAALRAVLLLLGVLAPSTAWAVASAELYNTQAYVYGRFEARIRYAPGDGVISSFFLWKEGSELADAYWNELDFEKMNANCRMQTNAIFGNPEAGHEQAHTSLGDLCGAYHDYAFEWTPTYIAWLVDGHEIRRETGATATAFSQNASAGMTFHFNVWPGNANFGGNFDPSILPTRQYISWVRYSSYENGSFQLKWQQEFQGTTLPSGWAVGNWASPLNLSTHNSANVSFVSGIAVLSLTADNATGFNGTPPNDTSSAGGASGGSGGAANGGSANGGSANGGSANGGAANGGMGTAAGAGNGGALTAGGKSSGGASSAGGSIATGGSGASNGGSSFAAGGTSSGGAQVSLGGASTAGSSFGGATGSATGGAAGSAAGGAAGSAAGGAAGAAHATSGGNAGEQSGSKETNSGCSCVTVRNGRAPFAWKSLAALGALFCIRRRKNRR